MILKNSSIPSNFVTHLQQAIMKPSQTTVLVTGGAGYIGSHACVHLLKNGHSIVVVDNLCNSHQQALRRVEQITKKSLDFYQLDIRDTKKLIEVLHKHQVEAVMHFSGFKAVGESVEQPLAYYDNNVTGSLSLLKAMQQKNIKHLVFSSSATVYGKDQPFLTEDTPTNPTNPYGQSKKMVEDILVDACRADSELKVAILRYFNPVGAHASGLIGEMPQGTPNNLMPWISQVAIGQREKLYIFGQDYPTEDGTGIRDYIHVMDVVEAHSAALSALNQSFEQPLICNLGLGRGYSVLQVIRAFEQASGKTIAYEIGKRRVGDLAAYYADTQRAHRLLGWRAKRDLLTMCQDTWRWQTQNPQGYSS